MGRGYKLKGKFKYETCTTSLSRKNDNCYSEENESRRSSRAQTEGAKLVYWNSRGLTRLVLAAVSLPHYPRGWSIPLEMRQRFRINARDRALTSPFAFPRANSTGILLLFHFESCNFAKFLTRWFSPQLLSSFDNESVWTTGFRSITCAGAG